MLVVGSCLALVCAVAEALVGLVVLVTSLAFLGYYIWEEVVAFRHRKKGVGLIE